jgi:hypothetical protein
MFPGTVSVGAVVSCTVTVKVAGLTGPVNASFALQVTVFTPIGKVEPDGREHPRKVTSISGSVTVGSVYVKVAPFDEVASTIALFGTPEKTAGSA